MIVPYVKIPRYEDHLLIAGDGASSPTYPNLHRLNEPFVSGAGVDCRIENNQYQDETEQVKVKSNSEFF